MFENCDGKLRVTQVRANLAQGRNHFRSVRARVGKDNVAECRSLTDLLAMTIRAAVGAINFSAFPGEASSRYGVGETRGDRIGGLDVAELHLRLEHKTEPRRRQGKERGEKDKRSVVHDSASAAAKRSAVAAE